MKQQTKKTVAKRTKNMEPITLVWLIFRWYLPLQQGRLGPDSNPERQAKFCNKMGLVH